MFGVIAVVEKQPVVDSSVAAYTPCNRLVGVRSIVPVVAIQVTKTMAKVPERQKIQHESPVDEVNRIRGHDDRHDQKRRGECRQLNVAPELIAVSPFPQVLSDRANIITEETQKDIAPRIFGFAIMAMPVDRQPIDGVTFLILPVRVPLVMLHMDGVVHRLRKTACDRLRDSKEAIDHL